MIKLWFLTGPIKIRSNILLLTMHDHKVTDEETGKSEIIIDYNKTKGGVDTCDKMCAKYELDIHYPELHSVGLCLFFLCF